jgi:hypothetical protein
VLSLRIGVPINAQRDALRLAVALNQAIALSVQLAT